MTEFVAALTAFLVSHVIPARPALRELLIARLGRRGYLVAYSLLSIALLIWLVSAAWRAPYIELWGPRPWQAALAALLVPVGLFSIFSGLISPNPLSVSFVTEGYDRERPGVIAVTRHPVLWGFVLWGGAHVIANGDLVSLILFGGLTLFAAIGMHTTDRRQRRRLGDDRWHHLAEGTSVLPGAALAAGGRRYTPDRPQIAGLAAATAVTGWLLFAGGHEWLFGADPLVWWK